ncbi:MAG: PAS domain-containing protein [Flavobacteriia bacterium]|nr:PAS domain-containing protein [Flavobacteriia bacterium]
MDYTVFDEFFEGIQIIDEEFRYLYVNNEVCAQAGVSKVELVGKRMVEVFPQLRDSNVMEHISNCMNSGEPTQIINEFTDPHGNQGYFRLRFKRLADGVLISSQDISSLKREKFDLLFENSRQLADAGQHSEAQQ